MDPVFKRLLQQHQQEIINDLEVTYIVDELFSKNALSQEDFDYLIDLKSRSEQARFLIEKLIKYGNNNSYRAFVDTLAKDYKWLYHKLTVENNEMMLNESLEDSLSLGDVPRLPAHHVRRVAVEREITSKLKQLARHKILALHGMSGCGKTCSAISVLRDNPDLINDFGGVVMWLNFGTCKTEDDIIAQQNKLLRKAKSTYAHSSIMTASISLSSISSNVDNISLSSYDWTWEMLRDELKKHFSDPSLKEALLVLDEVNEEKIVVAFDIGCKLMITTRDVDVVAKYHPQIVNVQKSFEEKEALELFASCLDEPVSKLPPQARKLIDICKGTPFNIALIGAQLAENKERLKDDPSYWKYYLNKLEKKDYFSLFKGKDNTMKKTIEVCINSLHANILPLYKRLAVLPDNVKVFAQVLSRLWNKDVTEVESIMKSLTRKSLIMEIYDREHKNYIYEVHDLIMNYLRTNTREEDLKKLHNDLLNSYNYDNVDNVSCDIPDDGYIAFYLGYHILKTDNLNNKWGLFNKLFLDLKFLGNKVRLTGPDDVKMDLQKYENFIVKDELDRDLIHSIRTFLSTHGTDLYHYPCTDIVQSILQHESEGLLYNKACAQAQAATDQHELYFDFLHEHDVNELKHSTIDVREAITAVCFLGNYVVVGTTNGLIKFFHSTTHKLQKELTGMTSPVTWVGVSCLKHPPVVAALSLDGIIKLWYVDDFDDDDDNDVIEEEPEEAYNNNHPDHVTIKQTFGAYIHCRWSANEEYLVAHNTKMIFLYKPTGDLISTINNFDRDRELLCCVTCNNDKFVAVATSNGKSRMVEIIDLKTKERVMTFEETDNVLDMVTVPGTNKIITLKHNEIMEHEFKVTSISSNKCSQCKCGSVIKSDSLNDNLSFKSIAVNKTGTLLFVSTDDSRVVCVNLKTHSRVVDLENRRGNVIAMAVSEVMIWDEFEPGSDVLLTGTDITENSAKVWYLDASYISQIAKRNGKVRLTSKFDVSFLNASSPNSPKTVTPGSGIDSVANTPKRHQSFANHKEVTKTLVKNTLSLDRNSLKPLNLKGICNNNDKTVQPLLAVVDDKNNIQVMRGRKVLTEILEKSDEHITCVKISPCNHYIVYGLQSGSVKKYTLRTKEMVTIMDVYSPVQYLNYVNPNLLMVAGKNRSLMAYRLTDAGDWKLEMLQRGNTHLGSQELLDDLQGLKLKNGQVDSQSASSGDTESVDSRERMFRSGDIKSMCKGSGLVECFWVSNTGLVTVEHNAATKLWTADMKVANILHARQTDVLIKCAALQNNVLVLCDSDKRFQTFELIDGIELKIIQEYKLNNVISSCALTADGNILALGLDSGNVVVWNVKGKRLITILKHHKTKVQSCCFSPVPERLYRSPSLQPHSPNRSPVSDHGDDQAPLVLVTMATEIVWWNITYFVRMRANQRTVWRTGVNAMTPIGTPLENRNELHPTAHNSNKSVSTFFFGDGLINQHCWREIWNGKTCKKGSKRQEILACIKLTGVNARKLCHDDWFTCFVTVDNPGHVHIMNVMKSQCS